MINNIWSYFKNKRILVTGASGFIATNLIYALKNVNCTIIRLSRSQLIPVNSKTNFIDLMGDVSTAEIWEEVLNDVDIIYHLAAQTSAYVATENPLGDFKSNVLPMLNLLEVCKKRSMKPSIIFSGTVTEVGMPVSLPVNETHVDQPITIYDLHKLMAENYLKFYSKLEGICGTTIRLSNVYGPGPKSSSSDRSVINFMMQKALLGEPITVYGKGDCLRDYVYIEDVVTAFLKAAVNIEQLKGKHFVLGSGEGYTITQAFNLVADRIAVKTGKRVPVKHIEPPIFQLLIEERNFVADTGKFSSTAGWEARYSLKEGIDKTLDMLLMQSSF